MTEAPQASGADDQWTCGKGLAEHATIPAKMAEFLRSLAANLDAHVPTIDTSDPNGQAERAAYVELSTEYEAVAAHLAGTAKRMRDYRDLRAARHHEEALTDARLMEAFEKFVALEAELADLLARSAEQDGQILRRSRGTDE